MAESNQRALLLALSKFLQAGRQRRLCGEMYESMLPFSYGWAEASVWRNTSAHAATFSSGWAEVAGQRAGRVHATTFSPA
eukprot:356599-Chlamydomonas_euryale.AAC.3